MSRLEYAFSPSLLFALFSLLLFSAALPAAAQTIQVQNGATVQVSGGAVLDLQGSQMDFGPAGATARLDETGAARVGGGTLTATRSLNSPSQADPGGLGAEISASVDLGTVTVTRGHVAQTGGGNQSIKRYYEISPSGTNSGLDATLTHSYADDELNGRTESDLELFKSTDGGSTWSDRGADSRDLTANTVTLSSVGSFSRWTLGSSSQPLPVELAGFEGRQVEGGVRLTWQTASEENNAGFRVQRRAGEDDWTQVGSVEGAGTTDEPQRYRFTDADLPYAADSVRYRLRQVDLDGTTSYSDPVVVDRGAVEELKLLGTAPNPAQNRATVRFAVPEDTDAGAVTMRLYDVLGRRVRTVRAKAEPGRHTLRLDVRGLGSGTYFLRLQSADAIKTQKVTVVR